MFAIPEPVTLHNIQDTAPFQGEGPVSFLRIPETLRVHLNDNARHRAFHSTGCELRFRLHSPTFTLRIRACDVGAPQHGGGLAQVLFGDFSHTYFPVGLETSELTITAPNFENLEQASPKPLFHPRLVRILLPTHAAICELALEGEVSAPMPGDEPARRVLHYGSSITQGSGSLTSRECWAARSAGFLEADLVNLGFGGGCHCEPEMADYLSGRSDFDLAILETGINMGGLDVETSNRNVENLIRRFTAAHPEKPVFCVGVFPCSNDLQTGYTGRMQEFRDLVQRTVAAIGSSKVHYLEGNRAMDPSRGLTTDLVHPSPAGMISIGEFVGRQVAEYLQN